VGHLPGDFAPVVPILLNLVAPHGQPFPAELQFRYNNRTEMLTSFRRGDRRMLRTALLVLLAALLAGGAMGQTQPPSPRPGQAGKPPQTIADPIQQHPAADERGTEQNPVIVRSIKSKEEAAQDDRIVKQKRLPIGGCWFSLVPLLSAPFCKSALSL
jgi:hypothetical protein